MARTELRRVSAKKMRATKIKRRNVKRHAANWERAFHSVERVEFVASLPCAACRYAGPLPRENAHTANGGGSRKADYPTIIPLCGAFANNCHHEFDSGKDGRAAFISKWKINPAAIARATEVAWCARSQFFITTQ